MSSEIMNQNAGSMSNRFVPQVLQEIANNTSDWEQAPIDKKPFVQRSYREGNLTHVIVLGTSYVSGDSEVNR